MSKRIAILQSNYIPWKGYFDLISYVDEFVIYDDVQYTKQDWRNRNKIKTPNGLKWLSVPVTINGLYEQKMFETKLADTKWGLSHWAKIENAYRKAPFFEEVEEWLKPFYLNAQFVYLSELNCALIELICLKLGIKTKISNSQDLTLVEGKVERLIDICLQSGASTYVSGPAAKSYINESLFLDSDTKIEWFDYSGYPEYDQLWGEFEHSVSILDLFFSVGASAKNYMRHVK